MIVPYYYQYNNIMSRVISKAISVNKKRVESCKMVGAERKMKVISVKKIFLRNII